MMSRFKPGTYHFELGIEAGNGPLACKCMDHRKFDMTSMSMLRGLLLTIVRHGSVYKALRLGDFADLRTISAPSSL